MINFKERIAEQARKAMETDAGFQAFLAGQPKEEACASHSGVMLPIFPEATFEAYQQNREFARPQYYGCRECREDKIRGRLSRAGAPDNLLGCTFENWTPGNDEEKKHLAAVREFAETIQKGFLILLGPVGVGKTHLAVAAMRRFPSEQKFVKQSTLLRQLRATYRDNDATNPIEPCQESSILVLDEMGVSGGGRDEGPMLHEILDFRYGRMKPTIITSNLGWEELRAELGDRLSDRMREAAFGVLVFSGSSHRPEHRDAYFATKPQPQPLSAKVCW